MGADSGHLAALIHRAGDDPFGLGGASQLNGVVHAAGQDEHFQVRQKGFLTHLGQHPIHLHVDAVGGEHFPTVQAGQAGFHPRPVEQVQGDQGLRHFKSVCQ